MFSVPSREQLSQWLKDPQSIRAIESLFRQVSEILPAADDEIASLLGSASKSNNTQAESRFDLINKSQQMRSEDIGALVSRLEKLEREDRRNVNISNLISRIENLERTLGV